MLCQLDETTEKYIKEIQKSLYFVGSNGGEELGIEEILRRKSVLDSTDLTELWRENGLNYTTILYRYIIKQIARYCAEVWVNYSIDGLYTHTYIFNQEPSKESVETIRLVDELKIKMEIGELKPMFTCWECGKESHWLDSNPSIDQFMRVYNNLKEKYCGC